MDSSEYHRLELSIAGSPDDKRRVIPRVEGRHRRILDVGCGAGQTLIGCNLAEDVFAVGLDTDDSAIALGKQLTSAIRFVIGEGTALPFADGSFDLVICRVALPYMHVARALSEMARVSAAGGDLWLVLHPFSMTLRELGANIARLQVKAGLYRTWVLANGLALHVLGRQWRWPSESGGYETCQTSKGMTRALRAAGFERIQITRAHHFVVTATKAW
ncbi:MAG TPA: methyltransferase domain-containing protein [Pyrinomonadaceae bacterium]|jgi:ubiquinone/menaquinone biosynthesis C-methylase UbiE|nr:methyltransferase domain-containing protein [Pyrinomonadaceae bacterium]